jgi:hypothetical protein
VALEAHRPAGHAAGGPGFSCVRKPRSESKGKEMLDRHLSRIQGQRLLFFNIDTDPAWKDPARLSRVQGLGGDSICRCRGHRLLFIPCRSGR